MLVRRWRMLIMHMEDNRVEFEKSDYDAGKMVGWVGDEQSVQSDF